jgi:predicted regulator of Ras-like GTPase activity (Roadblock/LC7/MglB family)
VVNEKTQVGGRQSLADILHKMHEEGGFRISVLASKEGLPIATAPRGHNTDLAAAIIALLQQVSNETQSQLDMAAVDEVTIRDQDRLRLVCRYLVVGEEELILAALVPPDHYYRRVTNQAIKAIRESLRPLE